MNDERHMNSEAARLPMTAVIASMVGLWLCYYLLTTARGAAMGFEFQGEMLWRRGLVTLAGIGVTYLLWLVLRFFDNRPFWLRVVAAVLVSLPASLSIAQINQWMFADIQAAEEQAAGRERGMVIERDEQGNLTAQVPLSQAQDYQGLPVVNDDSGATATIVLEPAPTGADRWKRTVDTAFGHYFLLLAWASLYFALVAVSKVRAAERRAGEFRNAAKAAELRSLRFQVNPHFLFNTLNSLSAMVMTGKVQQAEEMIQAIASFYRHSLTEDPTADVALDDEFDLQRHYLEIEAVRFPKRLRVVFDLPDALANCRVPGMILQPLVENSVKYGVSASNKPVTIAVSAREEYGRLVLTVADNGPGEGVSAQPVRANGFGIGLANVRDRLQARFGDAASIASGPAIDGYETELRLPLVRHG
ncbi:MAG: sensor histidine kinase [Qipengyuania sp.]